jgi:hypothetical protein
VTQILEKIMKIRLFLVVLISILTLFGCTTQTTNYTLGRDFSAESVSKIQKGVTTTDELVALLGEPYSKSVISENEEKWLYMYLHSSATVRASLTPDVTTSGIQKNLDVLIKDGKAVNYAYTEGQPAGITIGN